MVYAPSQTAPKRVIGALAAALAVVAFVAVTHDQASGSKTASTPTSLAASTELRVAPCHCYTSDANVYTAQFSPYNIKEARCCYNGPAFINAAAMTALASVRSAKTTAVTAATDLHYVCKCFQSNPNVYTDQNPHDVTRNAEEARCCYDGPALINAAATTVLHPFENAVKVPETELTPCIQWAGHKDTFDEPGMGGCAATSVLVQCVTWQGHQWQAPDSDTYHGFPGMTTRPGACAAAIALSAKTKGIATTCKHVGKIAKLPATELTPCIEWAGPGGSTIGANHFGGGPMGGCAALSTELLSAHKKMCTADGAASTELGEAAATPTELIPYWKGAGFSSLAACGEVGPGWDNCRGEWKGYKWVSCGGSFCREGAAATTTTELVAPASLLEGMSKSPECMRIFGKFCDANNVWTKSIMTSKKAKADMERYRRELNARCITTTELGAPGRPGQ